MSNSVNLCQFNEGPSIRLKEATQSSSFAISSWLLEDTLKSRLISEVEIQTRTDPHLVDAVRPSVPIESITGIWEDTLSNPELNVTLWEVSDDESDASNTKCNCPEVHSEWKRVPLRKAQKAGDEDTIQLKWVDVRNASHLQLETQAGCCHFLRSLLGTSHASMPWGDFDGELPPVVALVVSPAAALKIQQFRTGDACPSYFLHSVARLQLPTSTPVWSDQANNKPTSEATLLVYKTIPVRDKLSPEYPLKSKKTDETLSDGCLWERFPKLQDDEEDDEEIKNEHESEVEEEDEDVRMVCPPYISYTQDYPDLLEPLLEHLSTLREEAASIPRWTAWPERQHYRPSSANGDEEVASWTVFPLCHCFPANAVENRKFIDVTCAFVPQTVALLKEKLGDTLRTALFSRLDPETTLEAHTGWQDLANHVIRVHIPLVVPAGSLCGTWVDGCVETHQEGRPLCFDDAKVHRAFNYSKQERVVLILDLARPSQLPRGHATGGHTEELDSFINSLT